MTSKTSSPISSKASSFSSHQRDPRFHAAVAQAARIKCIQLIRNGYLHPTRRKPLTCQGEWKPRMDVMDDPSFSEVIAVFETPGVRSQDINLRLETGKLHIIGTRTDPCQAALNNIAALSQTESAGTTMPNNNNAGNTLKSPNPNFCARELRFGSFMRTIPIPEGMERYEVKACLDSGILTVSWPRTPASAKRIITQLNTAGTANQLASATGSSTPATDSVATTTNPAPTSATTTANTGGTVSTSQ